MNKRRFEPCNAKRNILRQFENFEIYKDSHGKLFVSCHFRGESEVSSTEVTASEQLQPMPSTAVVSGKRQRDEPQVTDRYVGYIDSSKVGLKRAY